jgi:hypothetical protein
LRFLESQSKVFDLVRQALRLELNAIKTRCLWLFSFLYDAEKIRQAKSGFDANTRESMANAFELIEMTVPKEFASAYITLFERSEPVPSNSFKKFFHEPILSIQAFIRKVLIEDPVNFGDWTKASILYSLRAQPDLLMPEEVSHYIKSENPMLRELAVYIKERNKSN